MPSPEYCFCYRCFLPLHVLLPKASLGTSRDPLWSLPGPSPEDHFFTVVLSHFTFFYQNASLKTSRRPSLEPLRALSGVPFFYRLFLPLHVFLPKGFSGDLAETLSGASPGPLRRTVFLSFFFDPGSRGKQKCLKKWANKND